ncbi:unnamed protein product [Medioppia subpectinata]|uniref:Cuticle protein 14 n=1 Tax=Medioppia subpectinata TaxID=1979941 RepID=A0A7R9KD26_9ACAR|nr:unnamed protein product [Medioppia subpectinata]CAG2101267.1 unnamed protein product [Medioppia subpectinata]
MKTACVILALCGYVSAGVIGYGAPVGVLNTGASSQFRSQDNIGNYAFGYNEDHSTGGTFRREEGAPGVQVGSYGLRDADGRVRVVNYVADAGGFRANIQTNEPGVEPKDPANVLINKAQAIVAAAAPVVAAAPLVAAPAVHHTVAAAPVVSHYGAPLVSHYNAPVAHYAAPVQSHSYSTHTQHVAGAPLVHTYAAAPVVQTHLAAPLAAPVAYATKTIHSAHAAPLLNYW